MRNLKLFDAHSHLQFAAYDADREAVLGRMREAECGTIIVGTQYDTSVNGVALAEKEGDGFYATIGLHPTHTGASFHDKDELGDWGTEFTSRGEVFDYGKYLALGKSSAKVVGVGECGLDYYRMDEESVAKQKEAFVAQIALANELNLPMMLHVREAYKDVLDIFVSNIPKCRGDLHFFAGDTETAKKFLDLGFSLSFTGPVTYPPRKHPPVAAPGVPVQHFANYEELIRFTPIDMTLSETDSPYVAPVPFRGKRCEPQYVEFVVKRIAEIKGLPYDEVAQILIENAKRVFSLS